MEVRWLRAAGGGCRGPRVVPTGCSATPENFGYHVGRHEGFPRPHFLRGIGRAAEPRLRLIVSAGNDGSGAVRQLHRILQGYPMREVAQPLIVRGEPGPADLARAADTGRALAAGLELGIF